MCAVAPVEPPHQTMQIAYKNCGGSCSSQFFRSCSLAHVQFRSKEKLMKPVANRTSLIAGFSILIGAAIAPAFQLISPFVGSALAAENVDLSPPKAWRADDLNAMTLDALPDIDWSPIESGTARNSETVLFAGENTVSVWDAGPAKLIIDTPFPYDEFVVILKGKLVLTDKDGNRTAYEEGDMFMTPKGFVGTWDMTEEYRELIVIDTEAYNADL